ncbi:MAG: glycosyl hydrolase family 3, partial [Dysgonamonadaceae bacterium]|nr:glycosyl hydrolase family 3 [Dysgonamonadaceae bacterium]
MKKKTKLKTQMNSWYNHVFLLLIALFCTFQIAAQSTKEQSLGERVKLLQNQLSIEEKIDLLCANAPAIPRLGIPAYDWWNECLHGVARAGKATVFPKPIGLGSMWDTKLVKRITTAVSDEARAKYHKVLREKGYSPRYEGITFFSPTLNIVRDPRWGRTSESFSEDPYLTGETGAAFIEGLQGDNPDYLKLVATPKHFVANNEENRRRNGSAEVDELSLREYFFPAFRKSIEKSKATSVMGAYNALNGVPCCANPFLLTEVLRNEWGFNGIVMSDGTAVRRISTDHKYQPSYEKGAAAALKAGCDMSLGDEYRDGLRYAYREGLVTTDDIDKAVERVLTLRFR